MARILVVDDDGDVLKMAERVLSGAGHQTIGVEDPIKAMERLDSASFDLLISDANMPHYSGFDLVKTVRHDKRFDNMAIAMLTGLRDRKDVEKAVLAGVDDYIVKPIDPILLMQKVEALFAKKPPARHPEVLFEEDSALNQAVMLASLTVRSISELGVVIDSNQEFTPGATIDLKGHFFETEVGIDPPPTKVTSVEKLGPGRYRTQLIFLGASEPVLQKIRKWILSHGSMIRRDRSEAA